MTNSQLIESLLKNKSNVLKQACLFCGIATSGTKKELADRIVRSLQPINLSNPAKLVSVDLGLKNFSYSVLQFTNEKIKIMDWEKVNVMNKYHIKDTDLQSMATIAYNLVNDVMLGNNFVIIEEQRYRTMGSSSVQEWTIKVNMLQSMLISTIYTMGIEKTAKPPKVSLSNPRRMSDYFIAKEKLSANETKKKRVALVQSWVRLALNSSESPFTFSDSMFNCLQTRLVHRKLPENSNFLYNLICSDNDDSKHKSDDLADCLLHGIAQVHWLRNRHRLCELKGGSDLNEILSSMERR